MNYRDVMWDNDKCAASEAVAQILPYVDLLKISADEADIVGGEREIPQLMAKNDIALIVETLGGDGARCFFGGDVIESEGFQGLCVDACGAGDAFWGAFVTSLLSQGVRSAADLTAEAIAIALRQGNIAGWFCIQEKGAIDSLPYAADIQRYNEELSEEIHR